MRILTFIITIFLIFGLLGVPNDVFAQESSPTESGSTLQNSNSLILDSMVPLLRGGRGGGGRGSRFRGSGSGGNSTNGGILTGWDILELIVTIVIIGYLLIQLMGQSKIIRNFFSKLRYKNYRSFKENELGNSGYIVCEKCRGYYKLEKGESPDDFDRCQCGGSLKYYKNISEL